MLQLQYIRDHKEAIVAALEKRNLEAAPLLDDVLLWDEKRRSTQAKTR